MQTPEIAPRTIALFQQMTTALGLDLEAELQAGKVSLAQLSELLEHCSNCRCASACAVWLDHARAGCESHPPGYCNNVRQLRMRRRLAGDNAD